MNIYASDGVLTIETDERIDSGNAQAIQEYIEREIYCEAFDPTEYYKIHLGENAGQHPGIRMVLSHAKEIHYYNTFNANNLMLYLEK